MTQPWTTQRLRAVTGVILFCFAATHLLNHALGLVSYDVMEHVRLWRTAITRSLPGTLVLGTALVVHIGLGLKKFAQRRTWRIPLHELVQLAFGVAIPLLLFKHIIGTRFAHELFGVNDNYFHVLNVIWPDLAINQLVLISLVWLHGCIGIHNMCRIRPWYQRIRPVPFAAAVLVPVLAYAGFAVAARQVRLAGQWQLPLNADQLRDLTGLMDTAWWVYLLLLVAVAGLHVAIQGYRRYRPAIRITYPGGLAVSALSGATLLETSRAHGIPHASVCGGRARCSTCRVRIVSGLDGQPPPGESEIAVLQRVGATGNVRLACQLYPAADLSVVPLLPASRTRDDSVPTLDKYFWGVEQEVTLMFADIRGFTRMSESQLPYDVVFLLNQYLASMSEVITDTGGYVDKFMGDGIMAIFGMDSSREKGARDAISAARGMSGVLQALNQGLRDELREPLRIGIGVHTGLAILGRIGVVSGTGAGERITALGDTVNTASRLESASKDLEAELVISQAALDVAGLAANASESRDIALRGKAKTIRVHAFNRALDLTGPSEAARVHSRR